MQRGVGVRKVRISVTVLGVQIPRTLPDVKLFLESQLLPFTESGGQEWQGISSFCDYEAS